MLGSFACGRVILSSLAIIENDRILCNLTTSLQFFVDLKYSSPFQPVCTYPRKPKKGNPKILLYPKKMFQIATLFSHKC